MLKDFYHLLENIKKKKQLTVTGLDSLKTFSKIVVRKTCESLENRSADAATNSDDKQNQLKK